MGRPLLMILLAILVVVAVFALTRPRSGTNGSGEGNDVAMEAADDEIEPLDPSIAVTKTELWERPLPGEEPAIPPIMHGKVRVDPNGKRLFIDITEEHGYYAETFNVGVWKKATPDQVLSLHFDKYLKANETLTVSIYLNPFEITNYAGGSLGTDEDWEASVTCRRARVKNPDQFPPQAE